jgi:leishmanolysin
MAELSYTNSNWHPMKVLIDFSHLDELFQTNPTEYRYMVQFLFPIVRDWIEKNLQVAGVNTTKVSYPMCHKVKVPAGLYKKEVQADLVIFVTAKNEPDESYVAWASSCELHGSSHRPTVGQVHMNLSHLKTNFAMFYDVFATVIHEITHVLGFSVHMFDEFIDPKTGFRLGKADVVNHMYENDREFKIIITPRVKSFVNSHFGCAAGTLPGAPLEDNGSSGSAGSHWEKLFFSSEFMSAASVTNPVISQLTIALLEDSGWYKFNKGKVIDGVTIDYEPFFWLKDKGCGVFKEKCPMSSSSCPSADINKFGCSYDNTFRGVCRTVSFANGCSYYIPYHPWSQYDCRELNHTNDEWKSQGKRYGEERGTMSRCWNGDITNLKQRIGYKKSENFCFKSQCTSQGELSLVYKGKSYPCTYDHQKIQINDGTVKGEITCPSHVKRFCQRINNACPNDCMGKGRCMANGQCLCYNGFVGKDCANEITIAYQALWGTIQEFETVKKTPCHGGGTWLEGSGTCMCKIGWKGAGCCEEDSLAASYWNGPAELKGPVYSRPSTCEAIQLKDANSNSIYPTATVSTGVNETNPEKAAISVVGFLTFLFALLAIN